MELFFFINQQYPVNQEQGLQLDHFLNEIKRISTDLIHNNQTIISQTARLEKSNRNFRK